MLKQQLQKTEEEFDKMQKQIREITRENYMMAGSFGGGKDGLCFSYGEMERKEREIEKFIRKAQIDAVKAFVKGMKNPEITDCDNGYVTSLTENNVRLTHNQTKGYIKAITDLNDKLDNLLKDI